MDPMNNETTNNNVKLLGIHHTPEIITPSLASLDELQLPPTPPPIPTSMTGSKNSLPHPTSSIDNSSSDEAVEPERSASQKSNRSKKERSKEKTGTIRVLSGLYARVLIVTAGIIVITEILDNPIPLLYYNGFLFSYLIGGSVVCFLTTYICVAFSKCPTLSEDIESGDLKKKSGVLLKDISIYLRVGILVLGLGMLTWIGLEIGTYFTPVEEMCLDELNLAQPILLGIFTFLQMHFLFMNIPRVLKSLGWFRNIGLMHLQAANLAVWIRLFLWETAKEWLEHSHIIQNATNPKIPEDFNATIHVMNSNMQHKVYVSKKCWWDPQEEEKLEQVLYYRYCLQSSTIGSIWEKAMPYIFPFVLQFSLVCSAVMFHLWQSSTFVVHYNINSTPRSISPDSDVVNKQNCSGRKIDCRGSSKGLFLGLLVTVVGLIVLILFFVLTNNQKLHLDTLFVVSSVHCGIMGLSILAVFLGLCQIRRMCPRSKPEPDLHSAIQSWGTTSVFLFGACGMIVGSNHLHNTKYLVVFVDGAVMIFHCCIQALFMHILNKKCCRPGCSHEKSKPGRQTVTFLIFSNLVLWLMESFTAQNPVAGQLQLGFYGTIPWGIMSRGILPIVMCYRFMCSATMMDTWRNSYASSR